jgi:hypothetical protein
MSGAILAFQLKDQCVLVRFKLSDDTLGTLDDLDEIHEFSDTLAALIAERRAGEFDGHECGGGEGTLFMYGPDADWLFHIIEPVLKTWEPLKGGYVVKRHGGPGSRIERIEF